MVIAGDFHHMIVREPLLIVESGTAFPVSPAFVRDIAVVSVSTKVNAAAKLTARQGLTTSSSACVRRKST
jgi:hypothetical protein